MQADTQLDRKSECVCVCVRVCVRLCVYVFMNSQKKNTSTIFQMYTPEWVIT